MKSKRQGLFARGQCVASIVVTAVIGATGCSASLAAPTDKWFVAETENIRLRALLPAPSVQKLALEMQEIHDAFASDVLQCGFTGNRERIEVTALPPDQFERVAPFDPRFESPGYYLSYGAAWVDYPTQIVVSSTFEEKNRQVYQHEVTHRLNAICFPNAPVWVNEGLAAFLETALFEGGKLSIGLPPYVLLGSMASVNSDHYLGMRFQSLSLNFVPPITTLMGFDYGHFYSTSKYGTESDRGAGNYAASWSLVHLLELGDPELHARFARYLDVLHTRNRTPDEAWQDEFGNVDLETRLTEYREREREELPQVDLKYRTRAREKPQIRPMRVGETHLHWSWLLGPKFSDLALAHASAAQKDPSSATLARAMTAGVYADNNKFGKAAEEIRKGLALTPNDARLLHAQLVLDLDVWKGMAKQGALDDIIERLRLVAHTASQLNALGDAELARGNAHAALEYTGRALFERPECWTCLVTRAKAQAKLRQWSEALDSLDLARRWISHNNYNAAGDVQHLATKIGIEAQR